LTWHSSNFDETRCSDSYSRITCSIFTHTKTMTKSERESKRSRVNFWTTKLKFALNQKTWIRAIKMMKTSNRSSKELESNYSEINNSFLQRKLIYWIHWTWIDLMNLDMIEKGYWYSDTTLVTLTPPSG
jgi:hypothetical protein